MAHLGVLTFTGYWWVHSISSHLQHNIKEVKRKMGKESAKSTDHCDGGAHLAVCLTHAS